MRSPIARIVDEACACKECGALPEHQRKNIQRVRKSVKIIATMTEERWTALMKDKNLSLTDLEKLQGWHRHDESFVANALEAGFDTFCTEDCKPK